MEREVMGRRLARRVLWVGAAVTAAGLALALLPIGRTVNALVASVLLGVGGSMVATVVVARIVTRSVKGVAFEEVLDALDGSSPLHRRDQRIELTIEKYDGHVTVSAEHTFTAVPTRRRSFTFHLTSSLARWGMTGSVDEARGPWPGQTRADLSDVNEPVRLRSEGERFIIRSSGTFRDRDAFTWTIDHVSTDLIVEITCDAELAASLLCRVSHHRAEEIEADAKRPENDRYLRPHGRRRITITFEGGTLPYQGFEVRWGGSPPPDVPG